VSWSGGAEGAGRDVLCKVAVEVGCEAGGIMAADWEGRLLAFGVFWGEGGRWERAIMSGC
jgi:hypothetical protein